MAEENNDQNKDDQGNNNPPASSPPAPGAKDDSTDMKAAVEAAVADALKDIKSKLDNAYKGRDEALAKVAAFEADIRKAELKRLEDEGKHKEVAEIKLAEKDAEIAQLKKTNTELSRDSSVRQELVNLKFRSDKAASTAFNEVISELVRDEAGNWVHKSGTSIRDYVKAFSEDETYAFLFQPKSSSGGGSGNVSGGKPSGGERKSLFQMSQSEVLELAAQGKLRTK